MTTLRKLTASASMFISAVVLLPAVANAQGRVVESDTHRFFEITEDVWHVVGTGSVHTMSNSMVLVGALDVLVVDSHVTPAAAEALIASLPVITDRPVRYLVNTHYHFDHAHGNQAFPDGVEIIGHRFTRAKLSGEIGNVLEEATFRSFSDGVPTLVANLEREAAAETDPVLRAALEERHRVQRDYMNAIETVVPTPPNITIEREMSLFQLSERGSREIQVLHLGRAHTGGDVVVFLPQERVVFTGDLIGPGLSYMGDGHVDEWPAALEALRALEFDVLLPGHGGPVRGKERITHFQAYLTDLWGKAAEMYRQGVSADDAAETIDMTNHARNYLQILAPGVDPRAVRRIYDLLSN